MKAKFIQLVLLLVLLGGAVSQALACVATPSDTHSCCRVTASGNIGRARLAAKTRPIPANLPPCCTVSVPLAPQQATINSREAQSGTSVSIIDDQTACHSFRAFQVVTPRRFATPAGYS